MVKDLRRLIRLNEVRRVVRDTNVIVICSAVIHQSDELGPLKPVYVI
jgi:hypothetical protein